MSIPHSIGGKTVTVDDVRELLKAQVLTEEQDERGAAAIGLPPDRWKGGDTTERKAALAILALLERIEALEAELKERS